MNPFDEGFNGQFDGHPINMPNDDVGGSSEVVIPSFIASEMGKERVIKEEYLAGELDIRAEDNSDDDRPSLVRFNDGYVITKDHKFKVGMEFISLTQFKNAILEHNMLNGREVRFEKND